MEREGFSLASVLLGYFMVAGGVCLALLGLSQTGIPTGQTSIAAAFGAGGFLGGFFAARASRGSTIIEPALGALLVNGTLVGLLLATPVGRLWWNYAAQGAIVLGGVALAGALVGAFLSEKLLGAATTSSIPWVLYVALAVAGGCFLAFLVARAVRLSTLQNVAGMLENDRATQITTYAGIAGGCLLAGLATGASARRRVLAASFLGAAAGVFGFFVLDASLRGHRLERNGLLGAAVFAAGGGLVTLVSVAIGWASVGRRRGIPDA